MKDNPDQIKTQRNCDVLNVAAMREALVQCELFLGSVSRHGHPVLNPGDKCTACAGVDELRGMVIRALSMSVRNCTERTPSNAAAMREALVKASDVLTEAAHHNLTEGYINECLALIHAAIAAPARNCDVFKTESERQAAFIAFYNEVYDLKGSKDAIETCDLKHDVDGILHDYIKWLFDTAKLETKGE